MILLLRKLSGYILSALTTLCGIAVLVSTTCQAQPLPSKAAWIAPVMNCNDEAAVVYFRRAFNLTTVPDSFPIRISADNRYRLLVNGTPVAAGPEWSDVMHWRYDTLDLRPYLQQGDNTLAVTVWNWGKLRPVAQNSYRTGLYVQGENPASAIINSGPDWKMQLDQGYQFLSVSGQTVGGYYAASPGEQFDASYYPWGWEGTQYDDSKWQNADSLAMPPVNQGEGAFGVAVGWQLVPGNLPPMEEKPIRFQAVRQIIGKAAGADDLLSGTNTLTVPANSHLSILLDQTYLTNAFTVLTTSGGKGSQIQLTYAESLKDAEGNKGDRNAIEGKTIKGLQDRILPGGGSNERFQSLWFRTYRYVQLDIVTDDQPLTINDIHGIFTGYPFELNASFSSNLDWIKDVWDINWRIARLCAYETYFDTPYYEQLQYIGDTRIQALLSLYMSGDDRLVRQAITHFANSQIAEGITASRYPSNMAQYIPTFSLVWVLMVNDYWMLRDDPQFVKQFLPEIERVLAWFEHRIGSDGLLGPIPWWPFMDWVPSWDKGIPPGGVEGGSGMITLQFAYALQKAAELQQSLGTAEHAQRYRQLASQLISAVNTLTWDEEKQLYRDSPGAPDFSQQTNILAVLTDAIESKQQAQLLNRILNDNGTAKATYYFQYYLFEAMHKAGLGDHYIDQLGPWQNMLNMGLTTTPENPDPTRSDSHAWAAHPNYGLLSIVLGVRPETAGFNSVRIAPALGNLEFASGTVPHPLGKIRVELQRQGQNGLKVNIDLPPGLSGTFWWNGTATTLTSGSQQIVR